MASAQMTLGMKIALADKYHLVPTRDQNGNYRVEDPVIKSFYQGVDPEKTGVYINRDRIKALTAAILVRQEHDALMESRRGFGKADPIVKPPPAPKPVQPAVQIVIPPPVVAKPAPKPRVLIDDTDIKPPAELEFDVDDEVLDNTGKREKNRRAEPRRSKKESIFLSTARVFVRNPAVPQETLATQAKVALSSAKTCRVAWTDILNTLNDAGALSPIGQRLLVKGKK